MRIKTTNVINEEESGELIRTVKCPFCNTFLKGLPDYVVVVKCRYCDREFKIEQDPNEWTFEENKSVHRTMTI